MLNLLIREDRHWLRKEYLLRFTLVLLFFVMASLLIWGVVIGSLYLQIKVEQNIVREELKSVKENSDNKNVNELLNLDKSLKNLTNQLVVLNFNQIDLLLEIVSKQQEGVNISLISNSLEHDKKDNSKVYATFELRGIALTRKNLVDYQTKLSQSEMFDEVEIPFSSFAQNSEIPFSAKIKTVELNSYFEELELKKEIEDNKVFEQVEDTNLDTEVELDGVEEDNLENENEE